MNAPKKTAASKRTTPVKKSGEMGASAPPTSASSWKKASAGGTLLTVPSGNTALVRSPGMGAFMEQGVIPNGLMPLVQEAMTTGEKPSDKSLASFAEDPKKLQEIMDLANGVTVHCCMDPVVVPVPLDDEGNVIPIGSAERDDDTLYVDEIDFNDKMYIFSFAVGGTASLEKFREELAIDVGVVSG